jgi:hypothetical protein
VKAFSVVVSHEYRVTSIPAKFRTPDALTVSDCRAVSPVAAGPVPYWYRATPTCTVCPVIGSANASAG